MICPNCGKELADAYKFCTACGAKLEEEVYEPEDEVTSRSESVQNFLSSFDSFDYENEETVILDYLEEPADDDAGDYAEEDSYDTFENEETVILQDFAKHEEFTEDEEAIATEEPEGEVDEAERFMHEYTTELRMEEAPDYEFEGRVPVHKAPPSQYEQDTAYINHLRALKQLMDDGIITEDEFIRKKQQILGI